ncbi:hypothetical protein ACIPL1_30775 [Pseudomonas sp. NPDC090202]|uniref:hypothetical protein n=1 Tax=unclassified Pseudomonas TaxID=196821 RepID=UPI0038037A92
MKTKILLSVAFSILAGNVFAADGAEHLKQYQVAENGSEHVGQNRLASDGADYLKAYRTAQVIDFKTTNAVAEVRSEFGSQYQRY